MQPINPIGKIVGIALGAAVVAGVGVTVAVSEHATSAPVAQTTPSATPATSAAPATTPVTVSNKPARSSDDREGDDDGGSPATPPVSTPVPTPPPATVPKQTAAAVYKNGTYTATGSYGSPGGQDQITVTVTLANDIITDVSAVSGAGDRTSQRYQNYFLSGYKQYVVGQNIASVHLTVVSGSSLTPIGFNNALTQIKAQAKA